MFGFGRPSLEREVQWDVRVHSSSCGAHCGVVHSPFEWVGPSLPLQLSLPRALRRQIALTLRPNVLRGCLRRDVVWWCFFAPDGAYDSVWDSVKPQEKRKEETFFFGKK